MLRPGTKMVPKLNVKYCYYTYTLIYVDQFYWTLYDQFDEIMAGVDVSEDVSLISSNVRIIRQNNMQTGTATTNSEGKIGDAYGFQILGDFDDNDEVIFNQKGIAGGYQILDHNITFSADPDEINLSNP